jgi:ketosteroid isomerase-like protein
VTTGTEAPEVAVVQSLLSAWARNDVVAMLRFLHPEVEWRPSRASESWARLYRGHAAVQEWTQELSRRTVDVRVVPERVEPVGSLVGVYGELVGTRAGEPMPPKRLAWVFEVQDGLVTRAEGFDDERDAARALEAAA